MVNEADNKAEFAARAFLVSIRIRDGITFDEDARTALLTSLRPLFKSLFGLLSINYKIVKLCGWDQEPEDTKSPKGVTRG